MPSERGLQLKPIVGKPHIGWKLGIRGFVAQIMTDVREPRMPGLQFANQCERLLHRRVHGMGSVAQRIQNQVIESAKQLEGRRRHGTEVGEICERAHAESVYGNRAMLCGNWYYAQSKEVEGCVECMNCNVLSGTCQC